MNDAEALLEEAQKLTNQAWEAVGEARIRLAEEALTLSEACADAYVLLAGEAAQSVDEAREYYEKGVKAGERAIGPERFAEWKGQFWDILETRPYMRARAGLAYTLWQLGERAEAIDQYQEMLKLNPGDNQGIRYFLVNYLLAEERHQEAADLLQDYEDDITADWAYSSALLAFRQEGAGRPAGKALQEAIELNPYVPDYLLGIRELPPRPPVIVGVGDESEAIGYAAEALSLWKETAGALDWLEKAERPALSTDPAEDTKDLIYLASFDADEGWWEDDEFYPPFELAQFLAEQEIPAEEQDFFRGCLGQGIGNYYFDIYGYHKFGERPEFLIDERMHEPYLFGYGAKEILEHKRISKASKLKVCRYLLDILDIERESGVPYGLITALGFLAAEQQLKRRAFLAGILALEFGNTGFFGRPDWMEGATTQSVRALADWLVDSPEMNLEEKKWWAWMLCIKSREQSHLAKAFADRWLDKGEIPDAAKLEVCWAWLKADSRFGSPPLIWRAATAAMMGEEEELQRLLGDTSIDLESDPSPDSLARLLKFDLMPDHPASEWRGLGYFLIIPNVLKRVAVPALVRFGEDLATVIDMLWDSGDQFDVDAINSGLADAIKEFHQQLAPDVLRRLIERGISDGKAKVRKTFYNLSTEFYGPELLVRALDDNARSIRNWARKKLKRLV